MAFVDKNNILYLNQFGFRRYHSTVDALIKCHDYIVEQNLQNKQTVAILLDLKKAFDSLDPSILIKKLDAYGISGPFNSILESYLTNRTALTKTNGTLSSIETINYGVPQGSVLGPILFDLYINDIKNIADDLEINLFADDTVAFCTGDLNEIEDLCN